MGATLTVLQSEGKVKKIEKIFDGLIRQGRYADASIVGRELLELSRFVRGTENRETLSIMYKLGAMLHVTGKYTDAEQFFRELLPLRHTVLGPLHPDTIAAARALSETLCSQHKYKESIKYLYDELGRCENAFGSEHELTIGVLRNMGNVYMMQRDSYLASSVLLRALELSNKLFGPAHPSTIRISGDLTEARGPTDCLALRQFLAAKNGLPIPTEPFPGMVTLDAAQFLRRYQAVSGMMSAGPEVTAATTLRFGELMERPFEAPMHMPSAFESQSEDEDSDDDGPSVTEPPTPFGETAVTSTGTDANSDLAKSFRSLVERSINAWKHADGSKGKTRPIIKHSEALRRLGSLDEFLHFKDHQYWFFQRREVFMRQSSFQKWNENHLDDYVLLPVEDGFATETNCIFISHYWRGPGNPDPEGKDLKPIQERLRNGFWPRVAYFWVDFTCLPQWERTEAQQQYFSITLKTIPRLVRDCCLIWHFPDFQPRLWVLFEAAEFTRNRARPIPLSDMEPFMENLKEMKGYGVRYVLNRHGYRCTNQGDRELVTGWLEILLILSRLVPIIRVRRTILDVIDNPMVGSCHHQELGVTVDKEKGTITMNERIYEFTPVPFEGTGPDTHVEIGPDAYFETELRKAMRRAENAPDDRGYEEIGREYTREGEYKIGEALHRKDLANKEARYGKSDDINIQIGLSFLAENLEKQGQYEEAEKLRQREVGIAERKYGSSNSITWESREKLATVSRKAKLAIYAQRWKLETLEDMLKLERPETPQIDASGAMNMDSLDDKIEVLENEKRFKEAKDILWVQLERKRRESGPYHLQTLMAASKLARFLQLDGHSASAETLFWVALAISDDLRGPEHIETLKIMRGLAECMLSQGKRAEGKEVYRQQLERQLGAVDFNHPDTFTARFELAQLVDENEQLQITRGRVELRQGRTR